MVVAASSDHHIIVYRICILINFFNTIQHVEKEGRKANAHAAAEQPTITEYTHTIANRMNINVVVTMDGPIRTVF